MLIACLAAASLGAAVAARILTAGNELAQLQTYVKHSPVNESGLFYMLDKCARGESVYPTSYYCGHQTLIHKLEQPLMVNLIRDVSCTYHISEVFGLHEERFPQCSGAIAGFDYYYVNITQMSCGVDAPVKGGASFDIYCRRGAGSGMGYVTDHIDGTFTVQCRVPRSMQEIGDCHLSSGSVSGPVSNSTTPSTTMYCMPGIEIKLDYEYYHAYSDMGFGPKQHFLLYNESKCSPSTMASTPSGVTSVAAASPSAPPVSMATNNNNNYNSNASLVLTPNPPVAGWIQYSNFTDAMWASANASRPGFPSRRVMLDILQHYQVSMLGESHMRYTWDLLIQMYAKSDHLSHLGRRHANTQALGVHFQDISYYWMVASAIRKLPCLANETTHLNGSKKLIYVLQSGTWDLGFAPARYEIGGTMGVRSMLDAVAERLQRKDCTHEARFIVVGVTLYPNCDVSGSDSGKCMRTRHFRSNPTIRAIDQWSLRYTRTQLGLSDKYVKFVDTSEVISPRLYTKERLCVNHFLCHKNGPIVETTPPGRAVLSEILRAIRDTVEEDGWSEKSIIIVPGNGTVTTTTTASVSAYKNIGDFDGKIAKVANGTDWRYFLVENGCRRELDAPTANLFSSSIQILPVLEPGDISMVYDTPLLGEPHLSWSDKTLYRIDASREIFAMGDSKRHSVKNMGVAMVRGLDLEKVRVIQELDMNRIPVGDPYVN